jgi:hypothetical protein
MSAASATLQQRRNERDFNYPKTTVAVPTFPEPGNRNLQVFKTNQLKALAEKRRAATGSTVGPSSPVSSLVVSSSPEHVGCLVLCLGLSGVLNLFCQNKLNDVSPYGWML